MAWVDLEQTWGKFVAKALICHKFTTFVDNQ